MTKALVDIECQDIAELEKELRKNGKRMGFVVEVVSYIEHFGRKVFAKIKVPYYTHKLISENSWLNWVLDDYVELTIPYKYISVEEQKGEENKMIREDFRFRNVCRNAIKRFYKQMDYEITDDDIFIVWQCKTLQNWKAMASTYISDGRYFEITYNGDKDELYLDAYKKEHNECIKFGE